MDNIIVYKTNPGSLQVVLGLLRKEGFNPSTLEDTALAPVRTGGTFLISITVPRDEAEGAKSVLRKWDQASQLEIEKTTRKLTGPLIFSVMVIVVLVIIFLFLGILWDNVPLLFVIGLLVFAILAKVVK
ncbi:MAG: hypothetical protein JXA81_11935 [Sedimentisphaerales bacterium]|nr:hypothetical protein [Sedimentisphaerales bacterium]